VYKFPNITVRCNPSKLRHLVNLRLFFLIFMVAPCIDNIKFFICPTKAMHNEELNDLYSSPNNVRVIKTGGKETIGET